MISITKLRENCSSEFEKHWNCLEYNNQVRTREPLHQPCFAMYHGLRSWVAVCEQEYYHCRKDERVLNKCVFEKLVSELIHTAHTVVIVICSLIAVHI